ncbi:MAG: DUF2520 domain-containing protein [Clostridium sp.]|nr:DUF2520 domain-containing protein [Clostridium sp.]
MNIGFIGAGKVGFSLGKYFCNNDIKISGYCSHSLKSAKEAADFTNSKFYVNLNDLIKESDIIFITTPDSIISSVWDKIDKSDIENKIFCHCSGSLSSKVFYNIEDYNAYSYSIHPLFAFSDKYKSHEFLKEAFITIEGSSERIEDIKKLIQTLGNDFKVISDNDKARYHLSSTIVCNLVLGLIDEGINQLKMCGFDDEEARKALYPLVNNSINSIFKNGTINSLTGAVERADEITLMKHLECLDNDDKELYKLLSRKLIKIAEIKNRNRDYKAIKLMMGEE